ncbi:MAG: 16S rRNA processing protein RimM [Saprospiraceae bacterium]|jgi:16S rRNA processing protein RimM|nr:16S rRNA processing protein RimM [Saprospiraceae bacterium]
MKVKSEFILVGKIRKPTGTSGYIKLEPNEDFISDLVQADYLFISQSGNFVPYFIEDVKDKSSLLIKLEDVDNPEDALQLNLKEIYLKSEQINSVQHNEKSNLLSVIDFKVLDNGIFLGTIESIEEYPQQLMAIVNTEKGQKLIPLVDEFILEMDEEQKELRMNLPDGLTEI